MVVVGLQSSLQSSYSSPGGSCFLTRPCWRTSVAPCLSVATAPSSSHWTEEGAASEGYCRALTAVSVSLCPPVLRLCPLLLPSLLSFFCLFPRPSFFSASTSSSCPPPSARWTLTSCVLHCTHFCLAFFLPPCVHWGQTSSSAWISPALLRVVHYSSSFHAKVINCF